MSTVEIFIYQYIFGMSIVYLIVNLGEWIEKPNKRREFLNNVCPTVAMAFLGVSLLESCSSGGDDSDINGGGNNGGGNNGGGSDNGYTKMEMMLQ